MSAMLTLIASLSMFGAEYVIDVPEGQAITNSANHISAASTDTILVKTGKGEYVMSGRVFGHPTRFKDVEIREGVLRISGAGEIRTADSGTITVKSNAVFYAGGSTLKTAPSYLHIEEGGIADFGCSLGFGSANLLGVTGRGELRNTSRTDGSNYGETSRNLRNFQGILGFTTQQYYSYFGDGESAANDVPFGDMKGVRFETADYNTARAYLRNLGSTVLNRLWGYGGQLNLNGGDVTVDEAEIGNFHMNLTLDNQSFTVRRGRVAFAEATNVGIRYSGASDSVVLMNGAYGGLPSASVFQNYPSSRLLRPNGARLTMDKDGSSLTVSNASLRVINGMAKTVRIQDGTLDLALGNFNAPTGATTGSPQEIHLDGGRLVTLSDAWNGGDMFGGGNKTKIVTDDKGGAVRSEGNVGAYGPTFTAGTVFEGAGDLTVGGRGLFTIKEPFAITGDLKLTDGGTYKIDNTTNLKNASSVSGGGDLHLGSVYLSTGFPAGSAVNLAGGPGAKIHLDGAASIGFSTTVGNRWALGPAGAGSSPFVRGTGGALVFQGPAVTTKAFDGSTVQVTINGGMSTDARGLPAVPMFIEDKQGSSWGRNLHLGTVNGSGVVVEFDGYSMGLAGGANQVAMVGYGAAAEGETAVGGLVVTMQAQSYEGAPAASTDSTQYPDYDKVTLDIAQGATLKVGHGYGYAPVALIGNGDARAARIGGAGTLDFGSAEGIIGINAYTGVIDCRIAGTGGLTFACAQDVLEAAADDRYPGRGYVILAGDNTYSGGTRLNMSAVRPQTSTAFGSGAVYVNGDMSKSSSQVRIDAGLNLAFANDFHLSGWGAIDTGAIHAKGAVRFTGDVTLDGATRLVADGTDGEIDIAGDLDGNGDLYVWNSKTNTFDAQEQEIKAYASHGKVILSGTAKQHYAGKVEVARSTLEIRNGATTAAGGKIVLDDGLLVVLAGADPVELNAPITGMGAVRIEGKRKNREVVFAKADETDPWYQSELTLELGSSQAAVNSLRGFEKVVASGSGVRTLYVTDPDEPEFTGEVGENVTIVRGNPKQPGLLFTIR